MLVSVIVISSTVKSVATVLVPLNTARFLKSMGAIEHCSVGGERFKPRQSLSKLISFVPLPTIYLTAVAELGNSGDLAIENVCVV